MSSCLSLDLLIPGVIAFEFPSNSAAHEHQQVHWTQEPAEITKLAKEAEQIVVAVEDQYWITKTIAVPQSFRHVAAELGAFEMGASLSETPDDFHFVTLPAESKATNSYTLVAAIRRAKVQHMLGSLIPSHRIDSIAVVPRSVALATGWMLSQRSPRPTLLATLHHGSGAVALVHDQTILYSSSLRVRAPKASQFATAAAVELATMLANWRRSTSIPRAVLDILGDLGRIVSCGDLDTEPVRTELVSRLNVVVESGSSAIHAPIPVPVRLRESWCLALGLYQSMRTQNTAHTTETMTVREVPS